MLTLYIIFFESNRRNFLLIFTKYKTNPWFNVSEKLQVSEFQQLDQQNVSAVVSVTHVCVCCVQLQNLMMF